MHMTTPYASSKLVSLPEWVPSQVKTYLAHVEEGSSLRQLARQSGVHASTVMRQVRRLESLRDDPLADAALRSLETLWREPGSSDPARHGGISKSMSRKPQDTERLDRDCMRALRALIEPGAILVIADGVEDAVIVVNDEGDRPVRRAVVSREVAEILALKEWIEGRHKGRLARYGITPAGRTELSRLLAQAESKKANPAARGGDAEAMPGVKTKERRPRTAGAEAPVRVLSRRKRSDGTAFLTPQMIRAGERFRESFEIARVAGVIEPDVDAILSARPDPSVLATNGNAALSVPREIMARESLLRAVSRLGPELAEAVILACCNETGMEQIEDQLDFPARSGKIVVRIALGTLMRHYDEVGDENHDLVY